MSSKHDDEWDTTVTNTLSLDLRRRTDASQFTLPTLRVVAGPDMLRFCSIYPEDEVVIGRDDVCELVLHDPSVSRRHAIVSSDLQGRIFLQDLGSTNGTARNGEPVRGDAVEVQVGDHLEIGGITLRIDRLGLEELAHLARVVERLTLANKDPLTGLLTRRYLADDLPGVLMRHHHARAPITAVFLDVDHFKRVNDTWGHAVGDEVLRGVARLLAVSVRDTDTCVRYGGEELVAILPTCDEPGGVLMAERVRQAILAHDWSHVAQKLAVTVSLGVAEHVPNESLSDWLQRADRALYAAKGAGRNRVVCASTL